LLLLLRFATCGITITIQRPLVLLLLPLLKLMLS
jgi:hypothetical protein